MSVARRAERAADWLPPPREHQELPSRGIKALQSVQAENQSVVVTNGFSMVISIHRPS